MIGRRDRYSGNILLYHYLKNKRAPIFLNRNLTLAFRVHQHLSHGDLDTFSRLDYDLRPVWKPPSWDQLDDMMETEKSSGSFVLEVHGISVPHGKPQLEGSDIARAKKARVLLRIKCHVRVSIFPQSSDRPCTSLSQDAILQADNKYSSGAVSIESDPIIIGSDTLASHSDHPISASSFKMALSVSFISGDEAEEFYRYLGLRDITIPPTRLSTVYRNILQCPPGKTTLHLADHAKKLAFEMEVRMYWADTAGSSILARWNKDLRNTELHPQSYPTPPLDSGHTTQYRLSFVYGTEIIHKSGLVCPHDGCRRQKTTDILDLRMHLFSWHDHFSYQAKQESIDEDGIEHWRFESEVADHKADQRASDRADEPFDVRVLAPEQPFDRQRHLDGDDDFHRTARLEKLGKYIGTRGKTVALPPVHLRRKPPDKVLAVPTKTKKTYRVPKAPPGITFFRSVTKQPLQAGDIISESDDELDLGWLQLRKNAEIDKESVSEPRKCFLKIYDAFIQKENLQSDFHAGDTIIRFAREKGWLICQEEILDELKTKLDELVEDGIISSHVHTACLEIVRSSKANAQEGNELSQRLAGLDVHSADTRSAKTDNPNVRKTRKGKGKAQVTDTGHLTPITADSDGDLEMREAALNHGADTDVQRSKPDEHVPYDECYCGEDALSSYGASPIIACRGIVSHCNQLV